MLTYIPNFKIYIRAVFIKDDKEYAVRYICNGSCKEDTIIKIVQLDELDNVIEVSEDVLLKEYRFSGRALSRFKYPW